MILGRQGSVRGLVIAAIVLGGTLGTLQFQISTVYAQIANLLVAILATRLRPVVATSLSELRASS